MERPWFRDTRVWLLAGSLLVIAALDEVFPDVGFLTFLVVPVVASVALGRVAWTAVLSGGAYTVFVVMNLQHGFGDALFWRRSAVLLVTFAISILLADVVHRTDKRLADESRRFRMLAENSTDVVVEGTNEGAFAWVSESVVDLLGWTPQDLVGTRFIDLVHPDDRDLVVAGQQSVLNGDTARFEVRLRTSTGGYRWVSDLVKPLVDDAGLVVGRTAGFRDVEGEHAARAALEASEAGYRLLAENAMDLVFSARIGAILEWVSPSVTPLLGYAPEELIGHPTQKILHPDDVPILQASRATVEQGGSFMSRMRLRTKDGTDIWVEANSHAVRDESGKVTGAVIAVRNIDDEVRAQRALEHEVFFDALTGLGKRSTVLSQIQDILDTRQARGWALICVGVDRMTAVNQAYTYAAGDQILRTVASRLTTAAGAHDRVARIAGDEFAVLLRDVVTPTDAANAAERLLSAVRGPVMLGDVVIDVTACAGVALSGGQHAEDLLRDATAAMRHAAAKGPDRWEFLDRNVGAETREALQVQASLRQALTAGSVVPWLMPIAVLDDGRVRGYEALARWVIDDGSVREPDQFLPVAEASGLILELDRTILRQSLDALSTLPAEVSIAVNMSAATLGSKDLESLVRGELDRTRIDPTRLHLEVTETTLFNVTDAMSRAMQAIADAGVAWWVDDFGTGFSSISHLRDLPIAGLKLDRTFTAGVTLADSHVNRLSQGLAGLAEGLGLLTIAEGVETVEQSLVLASQGWQMGQGWLYGKAAPVVASGQRST